MTDHAPLPEPLDLLIVGAGISGIGMAAHLTRKCPGKSYAILERRERLGGTWDLFRYPGVRSDSDMYTLGYEFEPWRDGKSIAEGETILAYLESVAEQYDIPSHIRFGRTVLSADWDGEAGLWTVEADTEEGSREQHRARFLFFASGYYDYDSPYEAPIPGLDSFAGDVLHPQFWPREFDATGKRIAVIGSGATAATVVPALAKDAASVTMLQRTPTWYISSPAHDMIANGLRRILPEKLAYALTRAKNSRLQQMFIHRSRSKPEQVGQFLKKQVSGQLGDAWREEDFTPPYNPWEQRLCLIPDGDLFAAIAEGSASIATGEIAQVEANGIALKDGTRIEADVIVTATGLRLASLGKAAVSIDGTPVDFAEHYYYRNCMFSNVPNLAALFGYLNAAWTLRVDLVADWLCRLFTQMDAWGAEVVTPHLAEDHDLEEADILWGFSSGYLQRGRDLLPKSATQAPWQLSMDYFADRAEMREAPIDDGILRFERRTAPVAGKRELA
ncbi:MAG: NAD(P)/FAD-dependent oxidoreductase [Sphingomonadaceae bacterium]